MIKFIFVLIMSGAVLSVASIAWPRLTSQPRPVPLEQVHTIVSGTQIGQSVAQVLGVTTPAVQPIDPKQIFQSAVQTVVTTVERRTQEVVVENAVKQLNNQFDQLPQEQKQQIQSIICKP